MRVFHKAVGDRDVGLSEAEICRRLRVEARYHPDAEQVMEQSAECIERLAAFRDSFLEIRMGLDTQIVRLGEERDRLQGVIADYARICAESSAEIRHLRQQLRAK
jgi:hypothetical protein